MPVGFENPSQVQQRTLQSTASAKAKKTEVHTGLTEVKPSRSFKQRAVAFLGRVATAIRTAFSNLRAAFSRSSQARPATEVPVTPTAASVDTPDAAVSVDDKAMKIVQGYCDQINEMSLSTMDDLKQMLSDLNTKDIAVSEAQLDTLKDLAADKLCTIYTNALPSMNSAELQTLGTELPDLLDSIAGQPELKETLCTQLSHLNHFSTHFSDSGSDSLYNSLTTDLKQSVLLLYQHGGLAPKDLSTEALLKKLTRLCKGLSSERINGLVTSFTADTDDMTQYQFLRLVADTPTEGAGTASTGLSNTHLDDGICRLGLAAERLGDVKTGYTTIQNTLHTVLQTVAYEFNDSSSTELRSFGSFRFDERTLTVLKKHTDLGDIDMVLAHALDLQNKILNKEDLTGPPSAATLSQFKTCGLIPDGQAPEAFSKLLGKGINSSKKLAKLSSQLKQFSKELSTNKTLHLAIADGLTQDATVLCDAFSHKYKASTSAAQGKKTVGDKAKALKGRAEAARTRATNILKGMWLKKRSKEAPSPAKYHHKALRLKAQLAKTQSKIDTATANMDIKTLEADLASEGISLGKDCTGEHLQLLQNKQMLSTEIATIEAHLSTPSATTLAQKNTAKVSAAISEKIAFLKSGNSTMKQDLIPGKIKLHNGQLTYFEVSRQPGGTLRETPLGTLDAAQANSYLSALKTSDNSKSSTVSKLEKSGTIDTNSKALNIYLCRSQLKGNIEQMETLKSDLLSAQTHFKDCVTSEGLEEPVMAIRNRIIQEVRTQLVDSKIPSSLFKDVAFMTTLKTHLKADFGMDTGTPALSPEDFHTLVDSQLHDLHTRKASALRSWTTEIKLSTAATKELDASLSQTTYATAHATFTDIIRTLPTGKKAHIEWGKLLRADITALSEKIGSPIDLDITVEAGIDHGITLSHETKTTSSGSTKSVYIAELNDTVSGGVEVEGGLCSFLSAALGVDAAALSGLHCEFNDAADAAGFMAAIRSGNPELALLHVDQFSGVSSKTLNAIGTLKADFEAPVSLPIEVNATLSLSATASVGGGVSSRTTASGPYATTVKTRTFTYSFSGEVGVEIAGMDKTLSRDYSLTTEKSVKTEVNRQSNTLEGYSTAEVITMNRNGERFTNDTDGVSVGMDQLKKFVDLPALKAEFPEKYKALERTLATFNPERQKLKIERQLKPEVVFRINEQYKFDTEKQSELLKDPANFTTSVSVLSTRRTETKKAKKAGPVKVSRHAGVVQSSEKTVDFV